MTYCPECEEWVELDEGRCVQCDVFLKKKKKKIEEETEETEELEFIDDQDYDLGN